MIGAGAAGLAAARLLIARSLRVIVLEARDRVGGRVRQGRRFGDEVAELGGEFIHGPAPETRALLRELGASDVPTVREAWVRRDGELVRDEERRDAPDLFAGAYDLGEDESVDRYLSRYASDPQLRQVAADARAFAEGFDAVDPAVASVRAIADEWGSGVDWVSARPAGGYGAMFAFMRDALARAGVPVALSTVVRTVRWQRGAVAVEATGADGALRTIHARAAIVTLPAGVLRQTGEGGVAFAPELPAPKRAALEHVEMGHVVKVVLWFRSAFWEGLRDGRYRDGGFFRYVAMPFAAYWTQMPFRSRSIVAWAGGPRAKAFEDRDDSARIATALDGFGALFDARKRAQRAFLTGEVHDWSRDPFSRGAYSYLTVGAGDARTVLGAPVDDTLFFAGEATATGGEGGTVNGALVTGERAARACAVALAGLQR